VARIPVFPLPSIRGDGAPGGARELARLPYGPCEGKYILITHAYPRLLEIEIGPKYSDLALVLRLRYFL
jgi:hypothetical protein